MSNADNDTVKQIFVKVFGFNDAERQLLLSGFQQTKTGQIACSVWSVESGQDAEAVLIDGDSWEAAMALANPEHDRVKLIWVGERKHPNAWRNLSRPLQWTQIRDCLAHTEALAGLSAAVADVEVDFDYADTEAPADAAVGGGGGGDGGGDCYSDTQPASDSGWPSDTTDPMPLEPAASADDPPGSESRVLVIGARGHTQLYWRAKLGSTGLALMDEAANPDVARNLLRLGNYKLVVLDLDSTPTEGWEIIREISAGMKGPASPAQHLLVTGENLSRLDEVRAWMSGASTMRKPLHPGKLKHLLERVQSTI